MTLSWANEKESSNLNTQQSVGACEINGETIALELGPGRKATVSLVQNLRARFVPPEPPTVRPGYSSTATGVSRRLRVGKPLGGDCKTSGASDGVAPDEHRLNTVKKSAPVVFGFAVFSIARMKYENPLCSLFAIYVQLPKLNVTGPIIRSTATTILSSARTHLAHLTAAKGSSLSGYQRLGD